MQPHVFVLMPLGVKEVRKPEPAADDAPQKPAVKINFDEVYELLIEPALTKAGCVAVPAKEEPEAGEIRADMYFELVTAEVLLADISIADADVFYQLGVRHGVASRGVWLIHGRWTESLFSATPERTFDYDGKLFIRKKEERDQAWQERLDAEVERLATTLKSAIDLDVKEQAPGSPVYKELDGLVPVEWKDVRAARSKYFGEVFADWKTQAAEAQPQNLPGDVLTFADEAPTRFHRLRLLWLAVDALTVIRRFKALAPVLEDLLALAPEDLNAKSRQRLVLRHFEEGSTLAPPEGTERRFKRVFVASGHMIDTPERSKERFPARKETVVRERVARQLESWNVGAGDLAICGGARGADMLFAELCADRGAEVWLFLPLPEEKFLEESVRLPRSDWEQRYFKLKEREGVKLFLQSERLKRPPAGASVYSRNNLWMINTARVEADDPRNLYALLVWDEKPTGDGAGGTSDFAARIKNLGGHLAPIINPTKL
jgi:hypothetical protein